MTTFPTQAPLPLAREASITAAQPARSRIRLDFLDGIRGLASLDIAFCHAGIQIDATGVAPILPTLVNLTFSHMAVATFIVLSGYCLMLPVVRAAGISGAPDSLKGGVAYLGRRARRILPAYYAALGLCLAVMALVPGGRDPGGPASVGYWWRTMWPAFTPKILISHLLLVHNFNADWIYKIDAPMWSVATEWQIYFFFPLILLPLHRRLGAAATILGAIVLALLALYLFPGRDPACFWLIALFALGMQAACNYPGLPNTGAWRSKISWGWAFIVTLAVWSVVTAVHMGVHRVAKLDHPADGYDAMLAAFTEKCGGLAYFDNWRFHFCYDLLSGLGVACFLSWAAGRSVREHAMAGIRRSLTLKVLASKFAVGLGAFSYSLYLTHALIESLLEMFFSRLSLGPNAKAFGFVLVALLASTAFAYLFYIAFEKPFMKGREAKAVRTA